MASLGEWLRRRFGAHPLSPAEAVDQALEGMRRRLAETRLQVAVARGAEKRAGRVEPSAELQRLAGDVQALETRLAASSARRDALVSALQRAEATMMVQHALNEMARFDAGQAFDALEAVARDADAQAAAAVEVAHHAQRERHP